MCMEHSFLCKCGATQASINFKNEIMPPETIKAVYCPSCSANIESDSETMITDNGWVIEYDMEVASLMSQRIPDEHASRLSPEILFDKGYCTWRGMYPGDHIDSVKEREEILTLAKTDPKRYLEEIKNWGNKRMERLKEEGWRKAGERVEI